MRKPKIIETKLTCDLFISTGLQPGVRPTEMNISRFNGFPNFLKAAEAAEFPPLCNTGLKPGANEG